MRDALDTEIDLAFRRFKQDTEREQEPTRSWSYAPAKKPGLFLTRKQAFRGFVVLAGMSLALLVTIYLIMVAIEAAAESAFGL